MKNINKFEDHLNKLQDKGEKLEITLSADFFRINCDPEFMKKCLDHVRKIPVYQVLGVEPTPLEKFGFSVLQQAMSQWADANGIMEEAPAAGVSTPKIK